MPWPSALFELFEAATRTDFEGLARNKAWATTASDIAGHGRGRPVRHPQGRPELLGQVKMARADRRCVIVWGATAGSVTLGADRWLDYSTDFDLHVGCADYTGAGTPQAEHRAHPAHPIIHQSRGLLRSVNT